MDETVSSGVNMKTCMTCHYFAPLAPGHAAICFEKWRGLPLNAAVPLTRPDDSCEKHDPIMQDEDDCGSPFDEPSDKDPLREYS